MRRNLAEVDHQKYMEMSMKARTKLDEILNDFKLSNLADLNKGLTVNKDKNQNCLEMYKEAKSLLDEILRQFILHSASNPKLMRQTRSLGNFLIKLENEEKAAEINLGRQAPYKVSNR